MKTWFVIMNIHNEVLGYGHKEKRITELHKEEYNKDDHYQIKEVVTIDFLYREITWFTLFGIIIGLIIGVLI